MTKKKRRQQVEARTEGKEKIYRGKSIDDLKKLDIRESAKILPSRSRRSVLRNFDVIEKFISSCEKKTGRGKRIKTHLRDIVIVPGLVGFTIAVHNGKEFQEVQVTTEMIGHRLGEFAQTRTKVTHSSAGIGATKGSKAKKK
ncbi:30S ribosomal protein S19 [Candidatus Pacearchaeota archaeon CG_4_9_14_0_2_um_filter_39_13]|nr:30S ribosomal protein S19 [Candidatus Pacearchaeota archaeon]PJC44360.1 MAG: 30S ribosomal protein S19 [Candidatus Pacearchaeota archaeon CG_4_9_14_0_2_um_filter_39_13]